MKCRRQGIRIAAILLAVFVSCLPSLIPSSATAGEFTMLLCSQNDGWVKRSLPETSSPSWSLRNDCQSADWPHLSIEGSDVLYGRAAWEFRLNNVKLTDIQANVIGDPTVTEIKYAVKLCPLVSMISCDGPTLPFLPALTSGPGSPKRIDFDSSDPLMPASVTGVRIEARCDRPEGDTCAPPTPTPCLDPDYPECPSTPEFGLEGIVARITDSTSPTLQPADTARTGDVGGGGWIGKDGHVASDAQDAGSGIVYLEIQKVNPNSGSSTYLRKLSGCTSYHLPATFNRMCPSSWTSRFSINDDPKFWVQGRNWISVRAYDMARNFSSPYLLTFDLDTVDPGAPGGLAVSGAAEPDSSWIASKESTVSWTKPAGDHGSPLGTVIVDVDPLDSGTPNPDPFELTGDPAPEETVVSWPAPGRWKLSVRYRDEAGNLGLASEREVAVDYVAPSIVSPELPDWVGSQILEGSKVASWHAPENISEIRSGLCGYQWTVGGVDDPAAERTQLFGPDVTSAPLPADLTDGRWNIRLRAYSCAGLVGAWTSVPFGVDLQAPTAGDDHAQGYWIPVHDNLTIFGRDTGGSGVERIEYQDGSRFATAFSESVDLDQLEEGRHVIGYHAVDRAGNRSQAGMAEIGIDRTAPEGRIELADAAVPLRIKADVRDDLSGISRAELQFKPIESSVWRRLGEPFAETVPGVDAASLVRELPDIDLPDGQYQLRLLVVDVLGNSDVIEVRADGRPAFINLPLRMKPTVDLGAEATIRCSGTGRRRKCIKPEPLSDVTVKAYQGVEVEGRLALTDGSPLAGRSIDLVRRNYFSSKRETIATVTTGADGTFSATVPQGVSREILARFNGDELYKPTLSPPLAITVPARLTFKANRRTVRAGHQIVFSGKLLLGGATLTRLGKQVVIQYESGRSWHPLRETNSNTQGLYRVTYALKPRRPLRLKVRAFVAQDEYWPFIDGHSRTLTVEIRP